MTLCDTAGQDTMNASALREICYAGCDVFLVCFSVVNPETYRSVQTNWIPQLTKRHKGASVILIGTQSDLRNDQSTIGFLQVRHTMIGGILCDRSLTFAFPVTQHK